MCRKLSCFICLALVLALGGANVALGETWEGKITTNNDSVEQSNPTPTGSMDFGSSDLEFMDDGGTQVIGLRFNNVQVPASATITTAYVVLTTEEIHAGSVNTIIQAHLTPNAPEFASTAGNISTRPLTTAVVKWSPEEWPIDNEPHQTSDISAVIAEIVNQPGWAAGNSIAVIFNQDPALPSTGHRTTHKAAAPGYEPLLHIEYTLGGATGPIPPDEQTEVSRDANLSWTAGIFAAPTNGHKVCFSKSFNDVSAGIGGITQSATSYNPGRLEYGTTYYWRVDENNAPPKGGVTAGHVWSFTTEFYSYPIAGANIIATASSAGDATFGPENTIDGSGLDENDLHSTLPEDMWLSGMDPAGAWIQYEFDKAYKLHEMWVWNSNQAFEGLFGFGLKDVTVEYSSDGASWTALAGVPQFTKAPGTNGYAHNTTVDFAGVPARHVRLSAISNWGGILPQYSLSEVRFFQIPVSATEPSPDSGATGVDMDVVLGWRAGREAVTHDVYLSADEQAVIDGTVVVATVSDASYSPEDLGLSTSYYWKVNEVNEAQLPTTWESNVWSFTTSDHIIVDNFEDYNDWPGYEIYTTWLDGYESPTNGSQVGYLTPPLAEITIVHGGKQSMPLFYSNTSGATYSEGERAFDPPQNWTKHGVNTLLLWFHGTAGNTGQMYVKINGTKVPYDGDAGNLALEAWQSWDIDLTALGANVQNVTKLAIGVEGNGAKGTLYLDDIQLVASAPPPVSEWRITDDADDVEEAVATGGMDITSSDLELPYENESQGNLQITGLRFTGIPIPKGATITEAWVRFQVDETKGGTEPVNLIIEGELSSNAAGFTSDAFSVSSRPKTTARVQWSVPNWPTVGDQGPDQTTPSIASVIQEIVNQDGWAGGAIVLTFRDDPVNPSLGVRCAEAGPGDDAALLHIDYQ